MNAWQYHDDPTAPGLVRAELDLPVPATGELLIRVHAAGVTPTELSWYPTTHQRDGGRRTLAVPGHEFSGSIAGFGPGVGVPFEYGQQVFGMSDWFIDGATAEFCIASASSVISKPLRLNHIEAASVPIGALTAWQALFDRAGLQPGERVLIHGGAGAVGVFAIQFARQRGAEVLTTASAVNREFLIELGADRVIDYRTEQFEDVVEKVDVVLDAVGGETRARSWSVLRPGGRLVTIAADSENASDERTRQAFFIVEPDRAQLQAIAELLDTGRLRPVVESVIPFDQAAWAYSRPSSERKGCGKTVLGVLPPS